LSTESHRHSEESEEHPIQKLAALAQTLFNFVACAGATILMWQETQSWRPFALALLIIPIHLLSKAAWNIGDAFRGFVAPSTYFTRGAKDAFKKKVFWLVGPQATASFWTTLIAWVIGYYALLPKTVTSSSAVSPVIAAQPVTEERPAHTTNDDSKIDAASIEKRSEFKPNEPIPVVETANIEPLAEQVPEHEPASTPQDQSSQQISRTSNPSFDCQQAVTEQERLICSSEELADLDHLLTDQYKTLMTQTIHKVELRKNQVQWLTQVRGECHDTKCMSAIYRNRIAQLQAMPR
jgi:uncharacterized protein YecT (DUF1311 family)